MLVVFTQIIHLPKTFSVSNVSAVVLLIVGVVKARCTENDPCDT